ncbi:G-protein coupled receptor 151-like [Anomaloglossus baeobatrachus]|uniref:G-protein coupled receptor 151-like n=1 Tax=Anomaloglossus baeobatrachus TaxID=238106 RepID=UPI003F4F5AAA
MNSSRTLPLSAPLEEPGVGPEVTVALPSLLTLICLLAVAGNLLLITILLQDCRRGRWSLVNCLVVQVGVADLLLALFCVPLRIATYAQQTWLFGSFFCRTAEWFLHSCLAVKSFTLAAIAHVRCRHVLTPPRLVPCGPRQVVTLLLSSWAVSLLLPLPLLLFAQLSVDKGSLTCGFHVPDDASSFMDVFSKVYPLLAYVLPMVFSFCCYIRALRRGERRIRVPDPRVLSRRTTSMLMSVSLAFDAMWLPEWIVWIWSRHSSSGLLQPPSVLMVLAQVTLFLNCTINPAVFLAVSDEFREGLQNMWTTCRQCDSSGVSRRENGSDMGTSTVQSLQDLHSTSALRGSQDSKTREEKILPDVEHFWQHRGNTTTGEDSDHPMPWEYQEKA